MKKKKRIMSLAMVLLLVAMLPITAFAQEYNIDDGDIQVTAKSDGKQYVTQTAKGYTDVEQTTPTVIKQNNSSTPKRNTITINAEAGKTAKVTLDGVNIDVSGNSKAAVSTTGKGDVTIELDGNNTIKSGEFHAGLEKNNDGKLTINDADNNGSLNATGGENGAGIGGGYYGDGKNITIKGGTVTATGGNYGAGIGGGYESIGNNITIEDSTVTATGGSNAAGIGSGLHGNGKNITIKGGTVTATGSNGAQDIGRGESGSSNGVTVIIGNKTIVNATRGKVDNRINIDVSTDASGAYTVTSTTEGVTIGNILYGGAQTRPTKIGTYPVAVVLTQGQMTYTVPIGELEITESDIDTDAKPVKNAVGTTSPQTADNSNIVLWMILLLASGGAGIGSVALARRKTSDAE